MDYRKIALGISIVAILALGVTLVLSTKRPESFIPRRCSSTRNRKCSSARNANLVVRSTGNPEDIYW